MSKSEWYKLATELQARWPNKEIPQPSIEIWYEDLAHLGADQVRAAIVSLYRDGREWCPNGAQILACVDELDSDDDREGVPRFETMWLAVKASLYQEAPERFLEPEHPLYLRFYLEQGRARVLGRVDESNSYAMHALQQAWKDLSRDYREEVRRGRVRAALAARPLVPLSASPNGGPRKLVGAEKLLPAPRAEEP